MTKAERQLKRRQETRDFDVERMGGDKTARVNLGLALLELHCIPGQPLSQDDIAAWCGCTNGAIAVIERKALKSLRIKLRCVKDPRLLELMDAHFYARQPAQKREID